jgi:hypothetical protein
MHSQLHFCTISRVVDLMMISPNSVAPGVGADKDFFAGENITATITIQNGETRKIRDIVVFGQLNVESSNNHEVQAVINCRNVIIIGGQLNLSNIDFNCRRRLLCSQKQFDQAIQDQFFEWMRFRKESVEDIGFKSILGEAFISPNAHEIINSASCQSPEVEDGNGMLPPKLTM